MNGAVNGDLSLSQSLGGLRIANPDDDGDGVLRSSSPLDAASSSPLRPYDRGLPTSREDGLEPDYHPPGGLDVSSLGFDPAAYHVNPSPFAANHYSSTPGEHPGHQRKLSHRQSMPIAQEAQQQPGYTPRNPPRPHNAVYAQRPSSGLYNHPNISSGTGATAESSYQRLRAESTQSSMPSSAHSSHATVSRSQSRTAAPGAVPGQVAPGPIYRQASQTGPFPAESSGFPPRKTSRAAAGTRSGPGGTPQPTPPPSNPSSYGPDISPLANSSEAWKERGAASGLQKLVDPSGKPTLKAVKKGVKDFAFGRTLGEGSYSTVLAATDRQTSREYAIKVLDKRHIIKEKKVKYVNIEKDTLNRLTDHPGIVRLYYTFQDERSLYFVLDLATGGELLGVLKRMTSFDEECSRFYGAQILDAIEYMHLRGVIHRDLKPENVLLDDKMHVKITDFGTAKILDLSGRAAVGQVSSTNDPMDGADSDRAVSFVGTAEYVSPELLTDKNACKASDLWAFGCIVYQLLAGRPPFKAGNEYQTFQKIVHLEYTFPEGFPAVAKDLVQRLLVLNPAERPHIDAIKNHAFFDGIVWGKGLWKQKPPRLRTYDPNDRFTSSTERLRDLQPSTSQPHKGAKSSSNSTSHAKRPQPRIITELAPPSQLDIDWSPVLTKTNERIVKLGQLVVYSSQAPHSPTSRNGSGPDGPPAAETPSKFSRLFGASTTKKRQRLVMVTSGARLVLAPSGGDKKEAKHIITLTDPDVSWRSQQDGKGYTVWCVFTREKHLTFEDPKANTGDAGSSTRSTQEWLDFMESVKDYAATQSVAGSYAGEAFSPLGPGIASPAPDAHADRDLAAADAVGGHRNVLRKDHAAADDDSLKGRKRFSKRHSKNGLAAVF